MRLKLVPNYNFKTHDEASALRDNLGEFQSLFNYLMKIVRVLLRLVIVFINCFKIIYSGKKGDLLELIFKRLCMLNAVTFGLNLI